MRNTFIKSLCEQAEKNDKIFLLCGDLGFSVLEQFAERFPDRYLNVGIAEQNMLQVASGLALEGYKVFVYSIGNFPTLRAMEQIRYDVCYHNLDVTIVAVGAGYAYGPLGTSHHTTEDIAMMRAIPNMFVCAPGDPAEAELVAKELCERHNGPAYVRINKAGEKRIHIEKLESEKELPIFIKKKGNDSTVVFSTGAVLSYSLSQLESEYDDYVLYSVPFISGLKKEAILKSILSANNVITIEEHQLNGGFGSHILELCNDLYLSGQLSVFPKIRRIGINNQFAGVAGSQDYLRKISGVHF
ncbi:transketolase family protein [Photorhabdus caribbeanensis]|uniref:transketolase family protein n=1 Tax=Photorhabdus caribbeanensis TaxID=1004165 RepID=UPI001BD477BF|nr:transketolase C-terminal domain-containing protein [Photorhabdus caribbeanensis]MBS9423348.1 transketolase [Photorhabdus caribbeanensis]